MINITIPPSTEAKLRLLARPFETREALIDRIAEAELARRQSGTNGGQGQLDHNPSPLLLDPRSPPDLTHTKVLAAEIENRPLNKPDWNRVLHRFHVLARTKLGSAEAVRESSAANVRLGKYSSGGYHFLPEAQLSVQGVDANRGWTYALHLAQALNVSIEVTFRWRDREDAAHPGKTGVLRWSPPQVAPPKDIFAEMIPITVSRRNVDDSRESIYRSGHGE